MFLERPIPTKTGGSHISYFEDTRFLNLLPAGVVALRGAELWGFAKKVQDVVVAV